jgi:hypothetical protein
MVAGSDDEEGTSKYLLTYVLFPFCERGMGRRRGRECGCGEWKWKWNVPR